MYENQRNVWKLNLNIRFWGSKNARRKKDCVGNTFANFLSQNLHNARFSFSLERIHIHYTRIIIYAYSYIEITLRVGLSFVFFFFVVTVHSHVGPCWIISSQTCVRKVYRVTPFWTPSNAVFAFFLPISSALAHNTRNASARVWTFLSLSLTPTSLSQPARHLFFRFPFPPPVRSLLDYTPRARWLTELIRSRPSAIIVTEKTDGNGCTVSSAAHYTLLLLRL